MIKVRISSKGQVVIPVEVRTRYNIDTGTELELREAAGFISLHPLPEDPVAAGRGFLRAGRQESLISLLLRERQSSPGREPRKGRGRDAADQSKAAAVQRTLFDPGAQ
ncbi:MAG: AbrB/MazE/SpoVT family DNA-binding domain-containing protein [Bacillota bacterium]|nr:AbrB/MazE/SpoVT family DNA-binding domain-containing protein [Bacillota bacterium]